MSHPETEADIKWAVGNAKRLERENERLRAALMRLANEVRATVSLAEQAIRESAGNTNYQCLMDAESEARSALKAPDQQTGGDK